MLWSWEDNFLENFHSFHGRFWEWNLGFHMRCFYPLSHLA